MSFDAWVVGFGLSRVLIELNLVESPWAYSVMAITILIDACLLYIFFTVQKASLQRSQALWTAQRPRDRSESNDRIPSNMTELPAEPFGPLARLLGYVLAIAAVAMLVYAVFPEFHLLP
jgi:hypothetical protein